MSSPHVRFGRLGFKRNSSSINQCRYTSALRFRSPFGVDKGGENEGESHSSREASKKISWPQVEAAVYFTEKQAQKDAI